MIAGAKKWADTVKRDIHAIYLAARDPRTPWQAKALAFALLAYALSPIDLIPDFIPVIGYLDDLVIVPLGIVLVVKLVPPDLMNEFRTLASHRQKLPRSWIGAMFVATLWIVAMSALVWFLWGFGSQ